MVGSTNTTSSPKQAKARQSAEKEVESKTIEQPRPTFQDSQTHGIWRTRSGAMGSLAGYLLTYRVTLGRLEMCGCTRAPGWVSRMHIRTLLAPPGNKSIRWPSTLMDGWWGRSFSNRRGDPEQCQHRLNLWASKMAGFCHGCAIKQCPRPLSG